MAANVIEAAIQSRTRTFTEQCGCKASRIGGEWQGVPCPSHGPAHVEDMLRRADGLMKQTATARPPSVVELWAQPAPARAVVLGKGPSLSRFVQRDYREWVVFAINEAVTATPGGMPLHVDYLIFVDSVAGTIANVPGDVVPIRPHGMMGACESTGYWFSYGRDLPLRGGLGGATGKAVCILGEWIKARRATAIEVLFVGCDSWDRTGTWVDEDLYADCVHECVGGRYKSYGIPNAHLAKALVEYREYITPRWFHREIVGGREHSKAV